MKNIKRRTEVVKTSGKRTSYVRCQNILVKNKKCTEAEKVFMERTEYENTGKEYNMLKFQQSTVIIIQLTHSNQTKEHCVLRQC